MSKSKGVFVDIVPKKQLVVKSNELIQASYKLTLQEGRVILLLASLIKKDDQDFNLIKIKVKDFVKFLGLTTNKDSYARVKKVTDSLGDKSLIINKINKKTSENSRLKLQWLASSEYFEGQGYVELEFSQKLKPYLLQLGGNFTSYQLENVLKLRRSYSIRLYEMTKQWRKLQKVTVNLEELKEILGITKDKYKVYGNFKKKILQPSQKEICEKTDICFEITEIKKSRKVIAVKFKIEHQTQNRKETEIPPIKVEKIKNTELYTRLVDYFCLTHQQARETLKKYSEKYVFENLAYVETEYKKGKIENIQAYSLGALKGDWRPQQSLFDVEKDNQLTKQKELEANQRKQERLEDEYEEYRKETVDNYRELISIDEIQKHEEEAKKQTINEFGKSNLGNNIMAEISLKNKLFSLSGGLSFEAWSSEKKI